MRGAPEPAPRGLTFRPGFPGSGGRVCGSSDLQGRSGSLRRPPHTEGPRGWSKPPPSPTSGCAFARRTVSRRSHRLVGGLSTGGVPRSLPRLLALPLPSSAFSARAPGPRGPYDRVRGILPGMPCAPLLILTPTFPSRPDPRGPTLPAGLPLLGFPKIAPPSSKIGESDAREHVSAFPSGRDRQPLPRAAHVVSHHLDGFFLSDRAGLFRPAADPGVRRGFFPSRNGPPPGASSTLRSFPPADSDGGGRRAFRLPVDTVGARHGSRPLLAVPFTANLASSPFTPGTVKRVSPPTSDTLSRGGCSEPRPRGLAPSSDPLRSRPLQDEVARCSLGLG